MILVDKFLFKSTEGGGVGLGTPSIIAKNELYFYWELFILQDI